MVRELGAEGQNCSNQLREQRAPVRRMSTLSTPGDGGTSTGAGSLASCSFRTEAGQGTTRDHRGWLAETDRTYAGPSWLALRAGRALRLDALSPEFMHYHSQSKVSGWFTWQGFEQVNFFSDTSDIAVCGTKRSSGAGALTIFVRAF